MNSMTVCSGVCRILSPWIAACFVLSAQAQAPASPATAASAGMPAGQMQHGEMKTHHGMGGMKGMHASGDADKDFAMNMKMHHEMGVEMSKMQLQNGKSPEMKKMAKQIIAAQNKEIAKFDRWLAKHK